jgi:hypothetical protein
MWLRKLVRDALALGLTDSVGLGFDQSSTTRGQKFQNGTKTDIHHGRIGLAFLTSDTATPVRILERRHLAPLPPNDPVTLWPAMTHMAGFLYSGFSQNPANENSNQLSQNYF